tara:strand:- start:604 stop:2100 length:1497 start_codon:yes stop_codon:yes gene_type:complete
MSTKINVRSPFYLSYAEPTVPEPAFTCLIANPTSKNNGTANQFDINQQGVITLPDLEFGNILSISSSDSGFSNNKYATVTSDTTRTITLEIAIPTGFSNTSDGTFDCNVTAIQPPYQPAATPPANQPAQTCSGGPTASSSIPAQTLAAGSGSATIDLAGYFSGETGFNINNYYTNTVTHSLSGSNLTLSAQSVCGTVSVHVEAYDNASNSCTAVSSISVTVNNCSAFGCSSAAFSQGSITASGTITNPNSAAVIAGISKTNNGTLITSYDANTGSSSQSVTLWWKLTAPSNYSNAGSAVWCSFAIPQAGTAASAFSCTEAGLYGQQISSDGVVNSGSAREGTIVNFTPAKYQTVSTDTARTNLAIVVTAPSGYSNAGSNISCTIPSVTQPAFVASCGSNTFYISRGKVQPDDFCDGSYAATRAVKLDWSYIDTAQGQRVCLNNSAYNGSNLYYAVSTNSVDVGQGSGWFATWQIDSEGIIQEVHPVQCLGSVKIGGPL